MNAADLLSRIDRRLLALGLSERAASLKARNKPDIIRNIRRAVEKSEPYDPRSGTIEALAPVLRTTTEWLVHGTGPEEISGAEAARGVLQIAERRARKAARGAADAHAIREIEIHAGMGGGGVPAREMAQIVGRESYAADAVRGYWVFPDHALRALGLDPSFADIVPGVGDSMEPDIRSGDWCVIDRRHRVPSPDGIYALWDGFSVVFKSLQLIPNSDPVSVRIISKNTAYESYERALEEVAVIGRVVSLVRAL
jgi:phage repressor protein C with HTH and peptisase S24 domain